MGVALVGVRGQGAGEPVALRLVAVIRMIQEAFIGVLGERQRGHRAGQLIRYERPSDGGAGGRARAEGKQEVKAGTEEAARYSRTSPRETACSCLQRRRKGR